jgi:hypothetical protein
MSLHLDRFVERLRMHESRGHREFSMSIEDAKSLHVEITRILTRLERLLQDPVDAAKDNDLQIELVAPAFKDQIDK